MSGHVDTKSFAREIARRDWIYAAHLFLCASMLAWRMLDATPGMAATQNGALAGSPAGVALTMVTLWLGVASLVGVIALTALTRKDAKLWILFVLMSLSMIWRRDIDIFDITYVALAAILAVWWFNAGRVRMKSELFAPLPTSSRAS